MDNLDNSISILDDTESCVGLGRGYHRRQTVQPTRTDQVQKWLSNVDCKECQKLDECSHITTQSKQDTSCGKDANKQRCKKDVKPLVLYPSGMSLSGLNTKKGQFIECSSSRKGSSSSQKGSSSSQKGSSSNQKGSSSSQKGSSSSQKNKSNMSESDFSNNDNIYSDVEEEIPDFSRNNPDKLHPKVGCDCAECLSWNTNDFNDDNKVKFKQKKKEVIKPLPFFKTKEKDVVIKNMGEFTQTLTISEQKSTPIILVHATTIQPPQRVIAKLPFITPVHESLCKIGFKEATPIQQYVCPYIMRYQNVCIVNTGNTGKTMSFIPPICSFLLDKEGRYDSLPKLHGPICIVLCLNSSIVERTLNAFIQILRNIPKKLKICVAMPPINHQVLNQFDSPCDILITTPKTLIALLLKNKFNLKRLCHLVIEDIDEIYDKSGEELKNLLRTTQEMLSHRMCSRQVQLICTSIRWTKDMENMLKTLYSTPVVCIGNFLEAAMYGRADFQIIDVKPEVAATVLYETLKDIYQIYKCVVFCEYEDIEGIKKLFELYGVIMVIIDESLSGEDITDAMNQWSARPNGNNAVLICTDVVFRAYLYITSATLLFNFSLPVRWGTFMKRFSCLIDNYKSPLGTTAASFNCKVYSFINETCVAKFPKLVNFFDKVKDKLPVKFLELSKEYLRLEELSKIEKGIKLCSLVKSFGTCTKESCLSRHKLSLKDVNENFPKTGILKFKLLYIKDVKTYMGRVYESVNYEGEVVKFDNKFNVIEEFFKNNRCLDFADNVQMNKSYIYIDESSQFRCRVLEVIDCDSITKNPTKVLIELIDFGRNELVTTDKLCKIPSRIKHIPKTYQEILIANIKAPDYETKWSNKSISIINKVLQSQQCMEDDIFSTANIVLQLNNSFWVEDITFHLHLENVNETVNKFITKKYLLENGIAVHDPEQIYKLYSICEDSGIKLPNFKTKHKISFKNVKVVEVKPQWAHFVDENYNAVYFSSAISPDRFYVRLVKFDKLLQNLQNKIQSVVQTPLYKQLNKDDIEINKYYLGKDVQAGNDIYNRVLVVDIKGDEADCFYVDFGDYAWIKIEELKYLREDLLTQLPFQIIECRLYGVESTEEKWPDQATNVLYDYCLDSAEQFEVWHAKTIKCEEGTLAPKKHSVVIFNCQRESSKMINEILLDCGLAMPKSHELIDKTLEPPLITTMAFESDDSEDDLKSRTVSKLIDELKVEDEVKEMAEIARKILEECEDDDEDDCYDDNNLQFHMNDESEFYKELFKKKDRKVLPITESTSRFQEIKALPLSEERVPEIIWHQANNQIHITINLCNVKDLVLKLQAGKVLIFEGTLNSVRYSLKLELYSSVEKKYTSSTDGPVIKITFTKIKDILWPRLPFSTKVMKNIKYNLDKCDIPDNDGDKRRKFLSLGLKDKAEEKVDGAILDVDSDDDLSDWSDRDSE